MKKSIEDKKGQQQNVETKWDEFRQAEQSLAEWLKVILSRVQNISVKSNDITSLENAEKEEIK